MLLAFADPHILSSSRVPVRRDFICYQLRLSIHCAYFKRDNVNYGTSKTRVARQLWDIKPAVNRKEDESNNSFLRSTVPCHFRKCALFIFFLADSNRRIILNEASFRAAQHKINGIPKHFEHERFSRMTRVVDLLAHVKHNIGTDNTQGFEDESHASFVRKGSTTVAPEPNPVRGHVCHSSLPATCSIAHAWLPCQACSGG